jgi:hypothetical protein
MVSFSPEKGKKPARYPTGHFVTKWKKTCFFQLKNRLRRPPKQTNNQANKQTKQTHTKKKEKMVKFLDYGHMIAIRVCLLGASSYLPSFFVLKKF